MIVDDAQKCSTIRTSSACCYSRLAQPVNPRLHCAHQRTEITQNCGQCPADIMALVLLTAPGKQGADIFLVRRNALAYRWVTVAHTRHLCGERRIQTLNAGPYYRCIEDAAGNTALRMAMQTREQHIVVRKRTPTFVLPRYCWQTSPPVCRLSRPGWPETYR